MKIRLSVVILGLAALGHGQRNQVKPKDYPYSPALVSTLKVPGRKILRVFPLQGKSFEVPLHSISPPIVYSPDGRGIYGHCTIDAVTPGALVSG